MVNPYNAAGAAAGAGAGGLLGRALGALDYPRQALWNIPDKIAQGDYGAAVPGLLGLGAGIGTAALGGGLPLAFLAGSLAGGAGQAVGSAEDPERFKAPTAEDVTGSDNWLLNTLTSMAGDPLTYAGAGGGHAAADALRPKSVLEKYPSTGFYGEVLPDASKPLVTLAQEAPKPPPPDMSPLGAPYEYKFKPPTNGMAPMSPDDQMRQYLNMLHDVGVEHQAGMMSTRDAIATQEELWRKVADLSGNLPSDSLEEFIRQMAPAVNMQRDLAWMRNHTASDYGRRGLGRNEFIPLGNDLASLGSEFGWLRDNYPSQQAFNEYRAGGRYVDPEIANGIRNHQEVVRQKMIEATQPAESLLNRVLSRFDAEQNAAIEGRSADRYGRELAAAYGQDLPQNMPNAPQPRMVRGDLNALDEALRALAGVGIPTTRRRMRDAILEMARAGYGDVHGGL